jgi:hypothetical protein
VTRSRAEDRVRSARQQYELAAARGRALTPDTYLRALLDM